jgi:hypothetical protein
MIALPEHIRHEALPGGSQETLPHPVDALANQMSVSMLEGELIGRLHLLSWWKT